MNCQPPKVQEDPYNTTTLVNAVQTCSSRMKRVHPFLRVIPFLVYISSELQPQPAQDSLATSATLSCVDPAHELLGVSRGLIRGYQRPVLPIFSREPPDLKPDGYCSLPLYWCGAP
ncbi:hypothetical protein Pcinc_009334 [Petrolisthes cinctipes]|uniref:Uncharacterized protein n=1 Tax=Petrolisthes cinctipes TaxID=88211 RepID=A0AAE1KWE5_PETCI|nr:hypothetical protein Pcinc_009334 [Petrolisthes cinctipes]